MSALSQPKASGSLTAQEYLEREPSAELRSEYIYGRIVAMAGASRNHNRLVANLMTSLGLAFRSKACNHYGNDMRVGVSGDKAFDNVVNCFDNAESDKASLSRTNPKSTQSAEAKSATIDNRVLG